MMRISKVRVQNFRSIEDTGFVDLNEGITSLVGRNEAGKTNFLRALASLHPSETYDESDLCRYNRLEIEDSEFSPTVATVIFECNMGKYDDIIDKDPRNNLVDIEVDKKFNGCYYISLYKKDEKIKLCPNKEEKVEERIRDALAILPRPEIIERESSLSEKDIFEIYREIHKPIIKATDLNPLNKPTEKIKYVEDTLEELSSLGVSKPVNEQIVDARNELRRIDSRIVESNGTTFILDSHVNNKIISVLIRIFQDIPSVIFHDELEMLPDQVQTGGDSDSVELTFDLLELAQISDDDLERRDGAELERMLKQRVAEVLQLVSDEWQRELNFDLSYSSVDEELRLTVTDENEPQFAQIRPSDRSDGLQYFISFCLNILLQFESEFQGSIMLFDGPGQQLHPGAKRDLLNVFENIAGDSQIVYSTHSPFLIDGENLDRVRVVKRDDAEEPGTKVTSLSEDEQDTVEPVWTALGANMERSPFGNEKNLLVEGHTDKVYFEAISNYLRKRGRQDSALDIDQTTIVPVGGDGKMDYLVRFAESHNYDYVSLLDNDADDTRDSIVEENPEVDAGRVHTLGDFVDDLHEHASVEDLVDADLLYEAFRETYPGLPEDEPEATIGEVPTSPVVAKYEDYVDEHVSGSEFDNEDKVAMAEHVESVTKRDDCDDERLGREAVENFIALFGGIDEAFEEH